MVKIDQVGEVVDPDPFDGVAGFGVAAAVGVIAGIAVQFFYLFVGVDTAAVGPGEFFSVVIVDRRMTVHADIGRWDGRGFAIPGITMAQEAVDLVETGVDAVGEKDGLLRLVVLLAAEADAGFHDPPAQEEEERDAEKGDVVFVPVEGDVRRGGYAAFFIGQSS